MFSLSLHFQIWILFMDAQHFHFIIIATLHQQHPPAVLLSHRYLLSLHICQTLCPYSRQLSKNRRKTKLEKQPSNAISHALRISSSRIFSSDEKFSLTESFNRHGSICRIRLKKLFFADL